MNKRRPKRRIAASVVLKAPLRSHITVVTPQVSQVGPLACQYTIRRAFGKIGAGTTESVCAG